DVNAGSDRCQIDLDRRVTALADTAVEPGELMHFEDGIRLHCLHVEARRRCIEQPFLRARGVSASYRNRERYDRAVYERPQAGHYWQPVFAHCIIATFSGPP